MKKFSTTFITILLFLSTMYYVPSTTHAQTFDANKAFSDYQFQQSTYQASDAAYQDAVTFYKKNPTLQLREEARQKTLKTLRDRDQLMVVYLTAIRAQLQETTGFNGDEKNSIFGKLDPEIAWYKAHITNYQDGDELASLFTKSDEGRDRYKNNTIIVVYESLFDITLSQEIGLRMAHQSTFSTLKNYINDQVSAGNLKIDPFNRWINDTDSVLKVLEQNENSSKTKISVLNAKTYNSSQTYNSSIAILTTSVSPLNQLNNYLNEMLTTISTLLQ